VLLLLALSSCGAEPRDETPWATPERDAQVALTTLDAAVATSPGTGGGTTASAPASGSPTSTRNDSDASVASPPRSANDASAAPAPRNDAGSASSGASEIDDLLGGLFGGNDGGAATDAAASTSGEWKLVPGSAPECPPEPPPIPIIGGACLGLYYACDWQNAAGETYTCICDWVHWLCI
jgi:hypothetical protein